MRTGDYGKKVTKNMGSEGDMVLPGSPDARGSSYGTKVGPPKNKTATGEPNTGIQGAATTKTGDKSRESKYGKKKSYKAHYGGAAGKTSKGKDLDHKVKRYSTKGG